MAGAPRRSRPVAPLEPAVAAALPAERPAFAAAPATPATSRGGACAPQGANDDPRAAHDGGVSEDGKEE